MKDLAEIKQQLQKTTDRLGAPIDKDIFETVMYLNVLGFPTTQSCAGHIGWSFVAPWVEISPKLPTSESWYEIKKNQQRAEKQTADLAGKLQDLLAEFYQRKKTDYELILIITSLGYSTRLHSAGLITLQSAPRKVQKEKLPRYQAEMKRFTEFLKGKIG